MTHLAHQAQLLKKTPFPHLKNQTSPKHKIGIIQWWSTRRRGKCSPHVVSTAVVQFSLLMFETDVLFLDFKSLLPWKPSDAWAASMPVKKKPSVLSPSHGKQRRRWDRGSKRAIQLNEGSRDGRANIPKALNVIGFADRPTISPGLVGC